MNSSPLRTSAAASGSVVDSGGTSKVPAEGSPSSPEQAPTASKVAADAIDLVKHTRGLRVANVVGGMPYQMQIARLQNADLVVATPGRLLDLQRQGHIKLDRVQFLVVDEAGPLDAPPFRLVEGVAGGGAHEVGDRGGHLLRGAVPAVRGEAALRVGPLPLAAQLV